MHFFHFSGNSERRVHVFLRHLEKMSHHFFAPKMGVSTPSGHFSKKGQKKGQKKFQRAGGKFHFLSREFSSRCLKNFFLAFLAFFAENGREGTFLVQKIGGTFFLGGVKKHELDVGNYR